MYICFKIYWGKKLKQTCYSSKLYYVEKLSRACYFTKWTWRKARSLLGIGSQKAIEFKYGSNSISMYIVEILFFPPDTNTYKNIHKMKFI